MIQFFMQRTLLPAVLAAFIAPAAHAELKPVIADIEMLNRVGATVLATQVESGVGYAVLDSEQQFAMAELAHDYRKCGGFEVLPFSASTSPFNPLVTNVFGQLAEQAAKNRAFHPNSSMFVATPDPTVVAAINQVNEQNLKDTVSFLSSYHDREYNGSNPNAAMIAFKARVEALVKNSPLGVQVDLIDHRGISQKSVRARISGAVRPSEIVVLGGHLDSINQEFWGNNAAPGSDDNASGSANILEALRIISQGPRPARTIEFFWYAGEEGGLLGSAEIAADYKSQGKDVVGVLQLDMTLYPGAGQFVLGSMTDYTSAWMRSYFENLNNLYIHAKIVDDKCGYACSDHATWYRNGYPSVMPFEATFNGMNQNLHTSRDVVDNNSNFSHSAMFAKIAVAIGLDLGNSTLREPKLN